MDRLGAYGMYRASGNDRDSRSARTRRQEETDRADKAKEAKKTSDKPVQLSDRAKALLEELKKSYTNMDFMVADYESDEEAQSYLSRGTKEFSVLIDPETLEKMAADSGTKAKYLGLLDEATSKLGELKEKLGEEGTEVKSLGVSIGSDGSLSYFAELEKSSEKQRERIEESRERRADEEKEAERAEKKRRSEERNSADRTGAFGQTGRPQGPVKSVRVTADSVEELYQKIRNVDWNAVKPSGAPAGNKFDFTV